VSDIEFIQGDARPICHDLFCGLGGWAEGFLFEGYEVIGYDIEKHDYGTGTYPGQFILCDVRSIHGSQLKDAAVIVASPPCQAYSYRAMPWKRAKALPPPDNELFNACFRIQREASEAAGHYIPMIVENVCGAQRWIGPARWHCGSFYLWGDIPALMPVFKEFKSRGMNWSDRSIRGQDFTRLTAQHSGRKLGLAAYQPGVQVPKGTGKTSWFFGNTKHELRGTSSGSKARKAASAEIAKIPFPLAQHIARCFRPLVLA
jgi:C-5 cytosine-specific DNA methylase